MTDRAADRTGGLDGLTEGQVLGLHAAIDTVIPVDDWPSGWDGGVERLLRAQGSGFMAWSLPLMLEALAQLDAASIAAHGMPFADLDPTDRASIFAAALAAEPEPRAASPFDRVEHTPVNAVVAVAFEGYYGGTEEPAGWRLAGFQPVPSGVVETDPEPPVGIRPATLATEYDAIVIGAGGGGGVAAAELSRGGMRVLLLERSRPHRDRELRGNHLQGKRMDLYEPTTGPGAGHPRVLEREDGSTEVLPGDGAGTQWALTAMSLGGGTRLWQGMSWRFFDEDFSMASTYGTPDDSTLADWPFGYDELAPYYDRVEWELGVSGDADSAYGRRTTRSRGFPMPPLPEDASRRALGSAAESLGWEPTPIPFAINSVPRAGRPACVQCPQCVGHSCPVEAKNGTHNTFIPSALATGNCDLLTSAQALRIEHDGHGTATAVHLVVDGPDGETHHVVRAARVVVAAGAIETPRLLLNSELGNDWVGRNHHTHGLALTLAASAPDINPYLGPGHSVAVVDYLHAGGAPWGGGVVFDLMPALPLAKAQSGRQLAARAFGREHKDWMRTAPNLVGTMSMVQEVPHSLSRVTVDPAVVDRFGVPVARLRGQSHRATQDATAFMADICTSWVEAAGGKGVFSLQIPGGVRGAEHSAGTARMGESPTSSACDALGRLHGTSNVFIADASLHPTNGGVNPGLTVMANALRVASRMLAT